MGKKIDKKLDPAARSKKRAKKKREGGPKGIIDVLNCPPASRFYFELVVGNGIGEDAVEDALDAFQRAWEVRREKAYDAAMHNSEQSGNSCIAAEHMILGPFSSRQDWKIDWDAEPMTAMTWCWVGYESIRFWRPA